MINYILCVYLFSQSYVTYAKIEKNNFYLGGPAFIYIIFKNLSYDTLWVEYFIEFGNLWINIRDEQNKRCFPKSFVISTLIYDTRDIFPSIKEWEERWKKASRVAIYPNDSTILYLEIGKYFQKEGKYFIDSLSWRLPFDAPDWMIYGKKLVYKIKKWINVLPPPNHLIEVYKKLDTLTTPTIEKKLTLEKLVYFWEKFQKKDTNDIYFSHYIVNYLYRMNVKKENTKILKNLIKKLFLEYSNSESILHWVQNPEFKKYIIKIYGPNYLDSLPNNDVKRVIQKTYTTIER
jgi:hypothetical protein